MNWISRHISIGTELSRFRRSRMSRAALVTILVMPLLYSALYLWAFWDPFNNTQDMRIAVVNNDKGAVVNGDRINAGDRVVTNMKKNKQLDWTVVSSADAADGVAKGRYYFAIELKPGFTKAIASPNTDKPERAQILITYNQSENYLSSLIGQTAVATLKNSVNTTIAKTTVDRVLVGVQEGGKGIKKASDGVQLLYIGSTQLHQGTKQLNDGLGAAHDGSDRLSDGLRQALTGADQLDAGINRLAHGVGRLGAGANELSAGIDQLISVIKEMSRVQMNAIEPIAQLANKLRPIKNAQIQEIVAELDKAYNSLASQGLGTGSPNNSDLNRLGQGGQELSNQLNNPVSEFLNGITQLKDGSGSLKDGLGQLSSGAGTLRDGLGQLYDGSGRLLDGSGQLEQGLAQLKTGLEGGTKGIPTWTPDQRITAASIIGEPVNISAHYDNPAPTFGYGMAPFFSAMALYVGGFMTWMLLNPLPRRALAMNLHPLRVVLSSYLPAFVIGIGQAAVIYSTLRVFLGLKVVYPFTALLAFIMISVCFMAIIQMFNNFFGVATGKVVSMAVLMLQLVSSGGLYPVETQDSIFRILHPFNPMTYAINALRQSIMGGIDGRYLRDLAVLFFITCVALGVSSFAAWRNRIWTMERLRPPVKT